MADEIASSPTTTTRKPHPTAPIVQLDSPTRVRSIDPSLPSIKVPDSTLPASHYHPVTCEPLTAEDLAHHKFAALRAQYGDNLEAAARARDEAVREVKIRMEESERRAKEVEKEMEEKEKMRELERRIIYQSIKEAKGGDSKG